MYKDNKELNPYPRIRAAFHDPLYMPGLDNDRLLSMQSDIINKSEVALSNQFIALLIYHLSKNKLMLQNTMDIIENWIPRHKVPKIFTSGRIHFTINLWLSLWNDYLQQNDSCPIFP